MRSAFLRSVPPGGIVTSRGQPEPGSPEHHWQAWISQPDRARVETTGPHGGGTAIHRHDRSWTSMPPYHREGRVGAPAPDVVVASWPAALLLDTGATSARYRLEPVSRMVVAARPAVLVEARPIDSHDVAPIGPLQGAEEVELAIDAERGVLLRLTAFIDSAAYYRLGMDTVAFDEPLDDDLFATPEAPAGSGELQQVEHPGPPAGVLGEAVPFPALVARNDSVIVAVDRIVAYPNGFEMLATVAERPGHEFHDLASGRRGPTPPQTAAEDLYVRVEFADGAQGSTWRGQDQSAPGGAPGRAAPVPIAWLNGHGSRQRFEQRLWVDRLPPPGELTIAVALPGYGIQEARRTLRADLIREAGGRSGRAWTDES